MAHCHALIASYKGPRSVEFRDALPMTGAGKIPKTVLRKPYWDGHSGHVNDVARSLSPTAARQRRTHSSCNIGCSGSAACNRWA